MKKIGFVGLGNMGGWNGKEFTKIWLPSSGI